MSTDAVPEELSYKQQLDKAAREARMPPKNGEHEPTLVEKIIEYVPAAAKVLPKPEKPEESAGSSKDIPGPPNRPDHDLKIEEFVRDQHVSKKGPDGKVIQ